jgi:hypothetical protein
MVPGPVLQPPIVSSRRSSVAMTGDKVVAQAGKFYVYAHYEADTGRLFYVGKGSGRRAWSRASRNKHWLAIAAKHDFSVKIIRDGLSEKAAYKLEAEIIASCENLATYTAGGSGISGYRHSDAARQAMVLARTGRPMSDEARRRMSETIRSRPDLVALRAALFSGESNPAKRPANRARSAVRMTSDNPMRSEETREKMAASLRGRLLTDEHKAKVSAALKGQTRGPMQTHVRAAIDRANQIRKRPVETECGLRFESTAAAARALGIRQGNIVNNCAGRAKSAGGYRWRYVDGLV